ncbi:hypothetical protein JCM3775_006642 [Rhodotorula graminis]
MYGTTIRPPTATAPTATKPPRRPISCASTPAVHPRPCPPSPSHRTLGSYPSTSSPTPSHPHSPHLVVERSTARESPIHHRDDGSTWRLVERVTEVFVVDVGPRTSPSPSSHRSPPVPARAPVPVPSSHPPSQLDDLEGPRRAPHRPLTTPSTTTRTRSPSPSPAPLSPRLAALAHTLRTLDGAELSRRRGRASLPRSPATSPAVERRTTSTSDVVAHGLELEGLATLFPRGVPCALELDEDEDESRREALESAWSSTSDEEEEEDGSEFGEGGGREYEEDESRTSSGSWSSFLTDDDASRRGSRDSWKSAATTVSAHSCEGGSAAACGPRREVDREADWASRRWGAWAAS